MSTFHEEESKIESLLKEAPLSMEAPTELKNRLRTMASTTTVRRPSLWPTRLAIAGVGLASIAIVALAFKSTTNTITAQAKTFALMVDATSQIKAFQFSITSKEGGKEHKFIMAGQDGRFGMRADDGALMQFEGAKMTIYDPRKNEVLKMDLGGFADPKEIAHEMNQALSEGMQEVDLRGKLEEYERQYGKDNIKIGPIVHHFGESTYDVDLQKTGEPEKVHMVVNADTDLPERIEVTKRQGDGSWQKDMIMELKFGSSVDIDLANPKFPANAKVVEMDLSKMIQGGLKGLPFDDKKDK